jgi:hypothetical protein
MSTLRMTLIGGPTALIEIDGFRLLTDPTEYRRHPERIHLPSLRSTCDEAIHPSAYQSWIASRSLSSGAHSRDPLARNDGSPNLS